MGADDRAARQLSSPYSVAMLSGALAGAPGARLVVLLTQSLPLIAICIGSL